MHKTFTQLFTQLFTCYLQFQKSIDGCYTRMILRQVLNISPSQHIENESGCSDRLLFISCKFVKGFLPLTFLLLLISSWTFHDVCQRFLYNQEQNFSLIRQKTKIIPIDPKYKNRSLFMSKDMTLQKWAIFIMGVFWEISQFLSDPTEILSLVI